MKQKEFTGAKVKLVLVDPWDFVTVNGSGPFTADVVQTGNDEATHTTALLLELNRPLSYKGQEYKFFIASTRHQDTALEQLHSGKQVGCNITGIPAERVKSANPFDLSWWRGGAAAIADVSLQ